MKRSIGTSGVGTVQRQLTATGTAGARGQLFTVYERNWHCKSCNHENYPVRIRCTRCKKKKPESIGHDYVEDPALLALKSGEVNVWKEAMDPASKQMYYYNEETKVTQWDRPIEMGAAPIATGWFGRGQTGSSAAQKYLDDNTKYLITPAKKQKEQMDPKKYHTEGLNEYNIWYDKYVGNVKDNSSLREAAEDRCVLQTDAGYTKADKGGSNRKEKRHFCLHFARGICAKGADCTYYHRVPLPIDDANCDEMFDCFGRQRHSTHRDDMNGVGSFMNPSRTLFVGNLTRSKYSSPKALEDAVWKHFKFAKEAMTCQSLDFQEILSIRWAKDDPNPIAQNSISMADKDALASFLNARGVNIEETGFNGPLDYANPEPKRVKLNDADVLSEYPELAYPDTDAQYAVSQYDMNGSAVQGVGSGVEVANRIIGDTSIPSSVPIVPTVAVSAPDYTSFFASLGGTYTASPSLNPAADHFIKRTVGQEECQLLLGDLLEKKRLLKDLALDCYVEAEENEPPLLKDVPTVSSEGQTSEAVASQGKEKDFANQDQVEVDAEGDGEGDDDKEDTEEWTAHIDPESGATYYYNSSTGESSWGAAPTS